MYNFCAARQRVFGLVLHAHECWFRGCVHGLARSRIAELQCFDIRAFLFFSVDVLIFSWQFFITVPINVIFDIVGMAYRGAYANGDSLSIFLIVVSALVEPVKVSQTSHVCFCKFLSWAGVGHGIYFLPEEVLRERWKCVTCLVWPFCTFPVVPTLFEFVFLFYMSPATNYVPTPAPEAQGAAAGTTYTGYGGGYGNI
jgi:hypothetical protein